MQTRTLVGLIIDLLILRSINKWWEIIFSAYLMISLNTEAFLSLNSSSKKFQANID